MNDSFVNWMIAGGARLDDPDVRNLEHLVALRESRRNDGGPSPLVRLTERLGFARQARPATDPMTVCCTA